MQGDALGKRLAPVDALRGAAIVAMIGYHLSWDLSYLGLWGIDVSSEPGWIVFQRCILGSFVFLVGVGLVLGHGAGIRWRSFWRRLGVLAAAALVMSVGTFFAFGDAFAFFGILHAIVVFSVLGLGFLRAPLWVVPVVAIGVIAAGILVHEPAFNVRWLAWIGFWTVPPRTADLVAIFPWFGVTLLGIFAGRLLPWGRIAQVRAPKWLALAGRWSLLIYLLHQPLLLGVLMPLAWALQPGAVPPQEAFILQCEPSCMETGGVAGYCAAYCGCALETIEAEGLWAAVNAEQKTPAQSREVDDVIALCRAMAEAPVR